MKSRNTATVMLMSASILLLLILQVLWLQNSYEKAFYDLRRDGNFHFRNTMFTIRDSLFMKNVKALPPDSLFPAPARIESVQFYKRPGADSMNVRLKSSSVQVIVKSKMANNDSIIDAIRPMAQNFSYHGQDGKRFVIQLAPDTISIDTINHHFVKTLKEAALPVAFFIQHDFNPADRGFRVRLDAISQEQSGEPQQLSVYRDTMKLEPVRLNPVSRYTASLLNFRGFIVRAIAPQIIFSILLTCITIIAFIVLYKSLVTQQRLTELKNDFIGNVTHELKTPVATVSVALEALKNFHGLDDPARTKEYLEIAQSELNRLTLMTDKILKAGAFENTEIVMDRLPVNIHVITRQIMDSMKLLFDKNKAQVTFQAEGTSFEVAGEVSHLTNVIYNLLDNALKYSPQQPRINVRLSASDDTLTLSVQDNGLGIPAEYKKKIFEKFFRVPTGDVHNIKGYGLGLSYVSSVVKAHSGTITVDSEPGKGSNFILTLPRHHG